MHRNHIQIEPIEDLERKLDYRFHNRDLIRQALTHSSAINENHPAAFRRDYLTLAFVGDAVLKYVVARHIFERRRDTNQGNVGNLHQGTQAIIPNEILAGLARSKLCLEKYMIRGNSHRTPSSYMLASCLEAIFGANVLDGPLNQQETISKVIHNICAERYQLWLEPLEDEGWIWMNLENLNRIDLERLINRTNHANVFNENHHQPQRLMAVPPQQTSCCQRFLRFILWIFALIGFFTILLFIYPLIEQLEYFNPPRKWYEL